MRFALCLSFALALSACQSVGQRYVRDTSLACSGGEWDACQALATVNPQALRDADAILDGMRRARSENSVVQGATP